MNLENELLQKKRAIDNELECILSQDSSLLFQAMKYAVLAPGKRFRPLLAILSGECFGASQDVILPFACALELIHNYSLIHDDLPAMDNDDFRRGKPSCHKAYGEDIALLAGDALLTLAFEVLARAPVNKELYSEKETVIGEISKLAGAKGMIGGQLLDVTLSPEKVSEENLYELMLKKTGSLIIAAVRVGAILGKASPSHLEAITEYGKNLGLAFQTRDDILDSEQDGRNNSLAPSNSVSLFGSVRAVQRLKGFIEKAVQALDEVFLESEGLRYMAQKLLEHMGR